MATLPNILLVDDLEENLVALEAVLQRDDARLIRARSGREALEVLLVQPIALALVDVQMPGMDGFELAELMRGAERTRDVPIIFVTAGLHDQSRIFKGYEAGGVDFLYKPIDPYILRSKVEVFLQLNRQRQLLAEQLAELRRAERELRELDRRKDEFLGLLSHELRNPLTPIRANLYVLQRAQPGSDQARRAQVVIERQVQHVCRLVDDLLDLTRITSGKVQLHRERIDLVEAVRRTVEDHRANFAEAGVALELRAPGDAVWCDADATRIAQAVGNLLGNAVKFTPRGGHVEVVVAGAEQSGFATIDVADDGVGLSAEIEARMFEPFAQADRTLDRSRGGLGLGLALVKGMVELHGGSVAARSAGPGRGTLFRIRLPTFAASPAAALRAPDSSSAAAAKAAALRRKVLVVEDSLDAADALREAIELMGHEVVVGRDGPEGIALADRFRPEVVICDIGLPGMNGYEVARRLHAMLPEARLVALTGYALPEDQRRAAEAGFAHHLAKPPTLEDLARLIAS